MSSQIVIVVKNIYSQLLAPKDLILEVREGLKFEDLGSPTGYSYVMHQNGKFPSGLLCRVVHLLGDTPHTIDDQTGDPSYPPVPTSIPLFNYQARAVRDILELGWRRGCYKAPPRSGKTRVAAAIIDSLPKYRPALFLVDKKELVQQSVEALEEVLGYKVGALGGGYTCSPSQDLRQPGVLVATVQTLNSRLMEWGEWLSKVKLCICDEVHHFQAPTNVKLLHYLQTVWRVYGLSGTPYTNNGRDLVLEGAVGPVIAETSYEELIAADRLTRPVVIFEQLPSTSYLPSVNWQEVYDQVIVENPLRNFIIKDFVDWCRANDQTCVVLVERLPHGEYLSNLLRCPFTHGSQDMGSRSRILGDLRSRKERVVVTTLYREAIDIPSLNAVVNAGAMKSPIRLYQGLRNTTASEGKLVAPVLDFMDRGDFVESWSTTRRRLCKSQPEFVVETRKEYAKGYTENGFGWLNEFLQGVAR